MMGSYDRKSVAWVLVAVLAVVGGVAFLAYRHHVASVDGATGSQSVAADAPQGSAAPVSESDKSQAHRTAHPVQGSRGGVEPPVKRSYADLMSTDEGFETAMLGTVALSLTELQWLDKHGRPSRAVYKAYWDMSIDDLTQRASAGDVNAAVIGAEKLFVGQFGSANKDRVDALNGPPEVARQALEDLMSSDEWKAQRVLLGKAVIGGSSYAAQMMSRTFQNPVTGACSDKEQCEAWMLVAWRMGDEGVLDFV